MKNIKTLLIILTAALFYTACQKDETPEVFDTISGVLSAGENVSAEDVNDLKVYLGRFHDSVDFSSITLKTTAIDSVGATTLNADGSFSFSGLTSGNYGLGLEDGFIITGDTVLIFHFNALEQENISKNIDRIPQDNGQVAGYSTPKLTIKRDNLSSKYKLKKLICYNDNNFHSSYDVPEFSSNSINDWALATISLAGNVSFKLEICTLDNEGNETDTFTTDPIPYYKSLVEKAPHSWQTNSIDIEWSPYSSSGMWWWKDVIPGYYLFSDHK